VGRSQRPNLGAAQINVPASAPSKRSRKPAPLPPPGLSESPDPGSHGLGPRCCGRSAGTRPAGLAPALVASLFKKSVAAAEPEVASVAVAVRSDTLLAVVIAAGPRAEIGLIVGQPLGGSPPPGLSAAASTQLGPFCRAAAERDRCSALALEGVPLADDGRPGDLVAAIAPGIELAPETTPSATVVSRWPRGVTVVPTTLPGTVASCWRRPATVGLTTPLAVIGCTTCAAAAVAPVAAPLAAALTDATVRFAESAVPAATPRPAFTVARTLDVVERTAAVAVFTDCLTALGAAARGAAAACEVAATTGLAAAVAAPVTVEGVAAAGGFGRAAEGFAA
jgi:hypothetical protein